MSTDDRLIGTNQAADMLEVDRATVTRWVNAGKLAAVDKLPGDRGAYVFRYSAVASLAAKLRAAAIR